MLVRTLYFYLPELCSVFITSKAVNAAARARRRRSVFFHSAEVFQIGNRAAVMACLKTKNFFESGSSNQFEWVLALYDEVLRLKAEAKSQKPENVIKLDKW